MAEIIELGDFETRLLRRRSERTKELYIESVEKFDDFLAENGRDGTLEDLDDWLVELQKLGYESSTINRHFYGVKLFFELEKGIEVPKSKVEPPRVEKKSLIEGRDFPKPETVRRLIDNMKERDWKDLRDRTMIAVAFSTGARVGEIADLDRSDYDEPYLTITRSKRRGEPKRDQRGLDDKTKNLLHRWLDLREDEHEAIFITTFSRYGDEGYKRMSTRRIHEVVSERFEEGEGKKFSPHTLRHSRASQMAKKGVTMKKVADYLSITIQTASNNYAHLSTADLDKVPPALGD